MWGLSECRRKDSDLSISCCAKGCENNNLSLLHPLLPHCTDLMDSGGLVSAAFPSAGAPLPSPCALVLWGIPGAAPWHLGMRCLQFSKHKIN